MIGRRFHRLYACARFLTHPLPGKICGRERLGDHEDFIARLKMRRQRLRGGRQPITGRRHKCEIVSFGIRNLTEQFAQLLGLREEVGRRDLPWALFMTQTFNHRRTGGFQLRPLIGTIEVSDILGNIEKRALGWDYRHI